MLRSSFSALRAMRTASLQRHFAVKAGNLNVDDGLFALVNKIAPASGVDPDAFWRALDAIVSDLGPRNKELLAKRDTIQIQLNEWHKANPGFLYSEDARAQDLAEYKEFLHSIGYLECTDLDRCKASPSDNTISTDNVDPELSSVCGAQLVCPVDNARFILKAANARWGSLLDAYYGTGEWRAASS